MMHLTTWPEYAAIRAQETVELTSTVEAAQLKPAMAPGAAQIITALAQLPWEPQESPDQGWRVAARGHCGILTRIFRYLLVSGWYYNTVTRSGKVAHDRCAGGQESVGYQVSLVMSEGLRGYAYVIEEDTSRYEPAD